MAVGDGEFDAAGVVLGVIRGTGVFGTSNRPRRWEAEGEGDADEIAEVLPAGVVDCSTEAGRLGLVLGAAGVEVAVADGVPADAIVADGDGVATVDAEVDVAPVTSAGALVVLAVFTNFFGGGFEGGTASDFIFSRVFLAAS